MSASKLRVYHKLQIAAHRVRKAADRDLLAATGVNTAQAAMLAVVEAEVSKNGSVTQREVARQLGLNESAVTSMASRLKNMSLLLRAPDADDVRAWSLRLSGEGRAARMRTEQPFRRINQIIENTLSADEIVRFADYLSRVATAFDKGER
jgi:DNA-binding MarR family transcriptional regulator